MSAPPSIVAFIPARSGSTRVPGKNVRRLGAHPTLAYSISAAIDSGVFGSVIVSTEDPGTAEIAKHYGADVPFLRPAELAGSLSPDIEWVEYTLNTLRERGRPFEAFSILRPTSPFRSAATIKRAWEAFRNDAGADSLRAVERCKQHPAKMWIVRGTRLLPLMPFGPKEQPWHSSQYQALPEVFVQNASLEMAWSRVALEGRTIAGEVIIPFITEESEGFDINDQWDWWMAEEIVRRSLWALPEVRQAPYPEIESQLHG